VEPKEEVVTDVTDKSFWETGYGEYQEDELDWFSPGMVTRRKFLALGGATMGAVAGAGPLIFTSYAQHLPKVNLPYKANLNVKGTVTFWHHWASPLRHGAIKAAIQLFHSHYKHVTVHDTPWSFGSNWTKTAALVAAGGKGAPDTEISNRPTLWADGYHKIYIDVSSYAHRDGINPRTFYPSLWSDVAPKIKGKQYIYGLPYETDSRFIFINCGQFIDAGLNPKKAPATWAEIPSYTAKLDKAGKVIGFYPAFGQMDLDGWVWTNKGDWVNKGSTKATVNTKANVATGDWYKGWIDKYGGIDAYKALAAQVPGTFGHDIFSSGFQSMYVGQPSTQAGYLYAGIQLRPSNGNPIFPYWRAFPLPHGPGGKPVGSSGGFAVSFTNNPHRSKATMEAAWEWAKFLTFVGQLYFEAKAGAIPSVPKMNSNPALTTIQNWGEFIKALKIAHPTIKLAGDTQYNGDITGPLISDIQTGKRSPKDAFSYYQDVENKTISSGVNKI
jgi:ABC-type glycerol-3-phosphate transport system substrate-binding protein